MKEEKTELNLDNPIFVYYFNCNNKSRQTVEQSCNELVKSFNVYSNATFWIVPTDTEGTRIECIYKGNGVKDYENFSIFVKEISDLVDSGEFHKLKSVIRSYQLKNIFE
jgi:hypothetical protein